MSVLQSVLKTPPSGSIWDLSVLKQHMRVTWDSEDALISEYAAAAEQAIDGLSGGLQIALIDQTWVDYFPDLSRAPILRLGPVASVVSVKVRLSDNSEYVLASDKYRLVARLGGAQLVFDVDAAEGLSIAADVDAVAVEYVAGFGADASSIPADIRQAHRLMVAHWYENREAVSHLYQGQFAELPMAVNSLLAPYRRYGVSGWSKDKH